MKRVAELVLASGFLVFSGGCEITKKVTLAEVRAAVLAYERERTKFSKTATGKLREVVDQLAEENKDKQRAASQRVEELEKELREKDQEIDRLKKGEKEKDAKKRSVFLSIQKPDKGKKATKQGNGQDSTTGKPDGKSSAEKKGEETYEEAFREHYEAKRKEALKKEGIASRTAAAVAFIPTLNVAQPALVQSFSLRNLVQMASPYWDPEDIRAYVKRNLELGVIDGKEDVAPENLSIDGNLTLADVLRDETQFDYVMRHIAQSRMDENWWIANTDVLSWDIGITNQAIGGASGEFTDRVDNEFPQFLFGAGLHLGGFELSVGQYLFRSAKDKDDFRTRTYFSISIDLFRTVFKAPGS